MCSSFLVFKRLRLTLTTFSAMSTVKDLSLPLASRNFLEIAQIRAQKVPTSPPYSMVFNKDRFGTWNGADASNLSNRKMDLGARKR